MIDKIAAFVEAVGGRFWHDTMAMVLPPLPFPIDISYVPSKDFKTLIIGLTFGDVLIYEPDTHRFRRPTDDEIPMLNNVGIYHRSEPWMDWHWDPAVKSIIGIGVYPQLGFASKDRPYELRIVNKTPLYVYMDATFWLVKFPNEVYCPIYGEGEKCDVEFLFKRYMQGIVKAYVLCNRLVDEVLKKPEDVDKLVELLKKRIS